MENSPSAMDLRNRVMPPELKQLEDALNKSGLNDNHDIDQLAFALFRVADTKEGDNLSTVGIAQGEFGEQDVLANFKKQKITAAVLRTNRIYPLTKSGMVLCFVDPSTMIFGQKESVIKALDARDGLKPNLLSNNAMMGEMQSVDSNPLWSILDEKGTQTMMKQTDGRGRFRRRLRHGQGAHAGISWYAMDFQHGVRFDLTLSTGDAFTAATVSSLMTAAIMVRKMSGSDSEKLALSATSVASNAGQLTVHFASTDAQFSSLLQSPLLSGAWCVDQVIVATEMAIDSRSAETAGHREVAGKGSALIFSPSHRASPGVASGPDRCW